MVRTSLIIGAAIAAVAVVGSVNADVNKGYAKRYPLSSAYFRGYSNARNKMKDTLFVVGDSNSDNGNMKMYTSGAFPYARRQYSDSRVWNERWAMENKYLLVNKAFGGATVSTQINPTFSGPDEEWPMPGIIGQMDMLGYAGAYKKCMDESNPINCIMVMQGISNDSLEELNKYLYAVGTGGDAAEAQNTLFTNMGALIPPMIEKAISHGFKKIVVTTAFPGSPTPYVKSLDAGTAGAIAAIENGIQGTVLAKIAEVKANNPEVNIVVWDMFSEMNEYLTENPKNLDVDTPCFKEYGDDLCANPRQRMWWDLYHPSSVVHQKMSDLFGAAVSPLL